MSLAVENASEQPSIDEQEETGGEDRYPSTADQEGTAATEKPPVSQRAGGRKKWLLVISVLIGFGFIAYAAKGFLQSPHDDAPRSAQTEIPATSPKTTESLVDFLVPLKEPGKKILLQVSLEVNWPQDARARYMQKQVDIRDEIYRRLRGMMEARLIIVEGGRLRSGQRAKLTDEITRILERKLTTRDIGVYIKEAKLL